jgi:hypothetical protein
VFGALDYRTEAHVEPLSNITRAPTACTDSTASYALAIGTLKGMRAKAV